MPQSPERKREYSRHRYLANAETFKARQREYYKRKKEDPNWYPEQYRRMREWNKLNREKKLAYARKTYAKHRTTTVVKRKQATWKLKLEVISAFGGICVCCKESAPEFLTLDHINGGGKPHRRKIMRETGMKLYQWLKAHGFPKDGLQLLCFNCNWAVGHYKICPHQRPA